MSVSESRPLFNSVYKILKTVWKRSSCIAASTQTSTQNGHWANTFAPFNLQPPVADRFQHLRSESAAVSWNLLAARQQWPLDCNSIMDPRVHSVICREKKNYTLATFRSDCFLMSERGQQGGLGGSAGWMIFLEREVVFPSLVHELNPLKAKRRITQDSGVLPRPVVWHSSHRAFVSVPSQAWWVFKILAVKCDLKERVEHATCLCPCCERKGNFKID